MIASIAAWVERSRSVVLDAQVEAAAVMAGEQPVEQRRAGAADVEIARRRRGKTGDDGHCSRKMLPAGGPGGEVCSMARTGASIR